ncbi:MAG: hypothetical protein AABX73_00230, partial [Nanoarchaeota archaeon]
MSENLSPNLNINYDLGNKREKKEELKEIETEKKRIEDIWGILKKKYNLITYLGLAFIVFISVWIRTRNLD